MEKIANRCAKSAPGVGLNQLDGRIVLERSYNDATGVPLAALPLLVVRGVAGRGAESRCSQPRAVRDPPGALEDSLGKFQSLPCFRTLL